MRRLLLILSVLVINTLNAQEVVGPYPPSPRYAPIVGEINESLFNQIIREVSSIYQQDGMTQLLFEPHWDNSFTVAYSSQREGKWIVYVNGGMARTPHMTVDAFRLLLCHEIGHHIGGVPFSPFDHWAAAEGQADYFAASKCLKRVLANKDNQDFISQQRIEPKIQQQCAQIYSDSNQQAICIRTALAGQALISAFAYMQSLPLPSLAQQDTTIVEQTITDDYPSIQCRLDTIVAGALCDIDPIGINSATSVTENSCLKRNGDILGVRPACWFNEEEFY